MCVIINMKPNTILDKEAWDTAVANNEHGFGMLVRIPQKNKLDKLELIKEFNANGNDPDDLFKIVQKYQEYERWIHLRYKTVGGLTSDNVQPFQVFSDNDGRVAYFMHNGTLFDFKSHTWMNGYEIDGVESDSSRFAREIIQDALPNIVGPNGIGDYACSFYANYVESIWKKQGPATNRGVIISNYAPTLILNDKGWTMFYNSEKNENGGYDEFKVSNDDYFQDLKRGKRFEEEKKKREEEARKKREEESAQRALTFQPGSGERPKEELIKYRINSSVYSTIPNLADIFGDPDIFDGDDLNAYYLAAVTDEEWERVFKAGEFKTCAYIMSRVCEEMYDVANELFELRPERDDLEARCIELENQLMRQKAQIEAIQSKKKEKEVADAS